MNWEDLRYFVAIASAGTLSGAARQLKVDQATVSRRLAILETDLGARLIDRQPRRAVLTTLGQKVLAHAIEVENSVLGVQRLAVSAISESRSKVTITAPPILARHFIAPHMNQLTHSYPDLQISVLSEPHFVSLSRMEADVALRLSAPIEDSDIARKIGTMKFALYASAHYPERDRPPAWAFIGYNQRQTDFAHKRWLYEVIGQRRVACEVADLSNQYEAACTGIGVAGLPCYLADADPRLIRLPDEPAVSMLALDIWIAKHPDRRDDPVVRAVSQRLETLVIAAGLKLDQR